jgi:hypothetical protein
MFDDLTLIHEHDTVRRTLCETHLMSHADHIRISIGIWKRCSVALARSNDVPK